MHDIYRTDKLSTDMGENDIIFIAPINTWNPITRSDKVACWWINQSVSLIYLRFICFPSASACVALIPSSSVNMSSPVWKFFSVAEEDNAIAICNACSARILRGGKKASSFNTTNLISHLKGRHRGEAVLRDFKQPPLLKRQRHSNVISRVRDFNCYFVAFYCNRLLRENSCFACIRSCCLKSLYTSSSSCTKNVE